MLILTQSVSYLRIRQNTITLHVSILHDNFNTVTSLIFVLHLSYFTILFTVTQLVSYLTIIPFTRLEQDNTIASTIFLFIKDTSQSCLHSHNQFHISQSFHLLAYYKTKTSLLLLQSCSYSHNQFHITIYSRTTRQQHLIDFLPLLFYLASWWSIKAPT